MDCNYLRYIGPILNIFFFVLKNASRATNSKKDHQNPITGSRDNAFFGFNFFSPNLYNNLLPFLGGLHLNFTCETSKEDWKIDIYGPTIREFITSHIINQDQAEALITKAAKKNIYGILQLLNQDGSATIS